MRLAQARGGYRRNRSRSCCLPRAPVRAADAHSLLAHRAPARRDKSATPHSNSTQPITSSLQSRWSWRGLTTWRSAAKPRTRCVIAHKVLRGFVCCNGLLDRAVHTNRNAYRNPGCLRLPLRSRASRRRVALIWMHQSRSRCPTRRAEDGRRRVASRAHIYDDAFVAIQTSTPAPPVLAHPARAIEPIPPRRTPRQHPQALGRPLMFGAA